MAFGNSIIARLGLDSRDFREGISSAQKSLAGLTAGSVTNLAGTVISGAAIKSVTEYASHVQELSERYNINAVALQRLGNAYEKEGGSLEGAGSILKKLTLASDRAKDGNTELQRSFANLGVTVDDLRTLSPEEILAKIGKSSMDASDMVAVLGRNALDIRPTLKKLADGTAEWGATIDAIDIKKLKEADDKLKALGQDLRVLGADVFVQIADGFHVLANDVRNMAETSKNSWVAALDAINHASKGNTIEMIQDIGRFSLAQQQALKDFFFYRENGAKSGAAIEARGSPTRAKSRAEEKAEQKERERNQLSLSDLAEGPDYYNTNLNTVSPQALYQSEQARKVKELEAEAQRLRTQQADYGGAQTLQDRADALRQSIGGLKDSEKQVGAFKQALDSSDMAENIKGIRANTEEFAIENL